MAALLNGTGNIREINHLNRLHAVWQPLTQHTDWAHIQGIYDWALLQRIQMKQFSHLIHSHPLFIPLGETETLGLLFSEKRPRNPIYSHEQKGNAMRYSGVNHQGVKNKKKSCGGGGGGVQQELQWTKSNTVNQNITNLGEKKIKKRKKKKTQNVKNLLFLPPPPKKKKKKSRCTQTDWPPSYAVGK